jgi:hypothetical protein
MSPAFVQLLPPALFGTQHPPFPHELPAQHALPAVPQGRQVPAPPPVQTVPAAHAPPAQHGLPAPPQDWQVLPTHAIPLLLHVPPLQHA